MADTQCLRLEWVRGSPHAAPLQTPLLAACTTARTLQAVLVAVRGCQACWALRVLFTAPDAADHAAAACSSFGQVQKTPLPPGAELWL